MNELCRGCNSTCPDSMGYHPTYKDHAYMPDIDCPCINCLVKTTCQDICLDYHRFEELRRKHMNVESKSIYRRVRQEGFVRLVKLKGSDQWVATLRMKRFGKENK
jgi:hypothetical protein